MCSTSFTLLVKSNWKHTLWPSHLHSVCWQTLVTEKKNLSPPDKLFIGEHIPAALSVAVTKSHSLDPSSCPRPTCRGKGWTQIRTKAPLWWSFLKGLKWMNIHHFKRWPLRDSLIYSLSGEPLIMIVPPVCLPDLHSPQSLSNGPVKASENPDLNSLFSSWLNKF